MQVLQYLLYLIGTAFGLFLLFVLSIAVSGLFVDSSKTYKTLNSFYEFQLRGLLCIIMFGCRIRLHVEGLENVPDGRFLLVGNHRSAFDPLCAGYVLRRHHLSFISKESNLHLFYVGKLSRRCCYLPIDRQNPREALKTIDEAADLINRGVCSVAVYPEGTRSKDGNLLPFHSGVLKIAQKANVPIVVMVVEGTENVRSNVPWRSTNVTLRFTEVLPADYVSSHRSSALGQEISEHISAELTKSNSL